MAEKIVLAEFEFDPKRLRQNLEETKNGLFELKRQQDDVRDSIKKTEGEISKLIKQNENLTKSGRGQGKEYEANKEKIEKYRDSLKSSFDDTLRIQNQQAKLRKEYNQTQQSIDALHKVNEINIKDYEVIGKSIETLQEEYSALVKIRNKMIITEGEESEATQTLNRAIEDNVKARKNQVSDAETRFFTVGEYQKELAGGFDQVSNSIDLLKKGDLSGFLMEGEKGFKAITKAAWGFITTPIGAALAVLSVVAIATKEWYDFNEQVFEANKLIEQVAGTTGKATDELRIQAQTINEVFGRDLKETAKELKILQDEFGLSSEKAFEIYTDGLIRGGNQNKEFGDSIREYSKFFSDAGFSGQEFINLINKGVDLKIWSDKLPDAIKEGYLSIREQTKATTTALENAFGASFTNELLNNVNTGKITVKDALLEISEQAEKTNLTQKQLATLTADVFKSAGEDAGGAAIVLQAFRDSVNGINSEYTEMQRLTLEQVESIKKLKTAQDEALNSKDLIAYIQELKLLWIEVKTGFFNAISWIAKTDEAMYVWLKSAEIRIKTTFGSIPQYAKAAFDSVVSIVKDTGKALSYLGGVVKSVFTLDYDGITNNFNQLKNIVINAAKPLKDYGDNVEANIESQINSFKDLRKAKKDALAWEGSKDDLKKAMDAVKSVADQASKIGNKTNFPGVPTSNKEKKEKDTSEKDAKELLQVQKNITDTNIALMKMELDAYLQNNKSKLEDAKRLSENLIKEEERRLNEILDKNLDLSYKEEAAKRNEIISSVKNEEERNLKLEALDQEYSLKRVDLVNATSKQINDTQKKYDEQLKEEQKQKALIDFQDRIDTLEAQLYSEFDLKQAQLDFEYNNNEEKRVAQEELDFINQQELELQKADINAQLDEATLERQLALKQKLLNIDYGYTQASLKLSQEKDQAEYKSYAAIAGGIAKIAGENTVLGKAAGIAEATINTYAGATAALENPYPLNLIAFATTLATGLTSVAKIAGVDTGKASEGISQIGGVTTSLVKLNRPSLEGFKKGGYTGNIPRDAVSGPVHGQEIVFSYDDIQKLGGVGIVESMRPTSPTYSGVGVNPTNTTAFQRSVTNNINMDVVAEQIRQGVYEGSLQGTQAGSRQGMAELNENIQIADGATW